MGVWYKVGGKAGQLCHAVFPPFTREFCSKFCSGNFRHILRKYWNSQSKFKRRRGSCKRWCSPLYLYIYMWRLFYICPICDAPHRGHMYKVPEVCESLIEAKFLFHFWSIFDKINFSQSENCEFYIVEFTLTTPYFTSNFYSTSAVLSPRQLNGSTATDWLPSCLCFVPGNLRCSHPWSRYGRQLFPL